MLRRHFLQNALAGLVGLAIAPAVKLIEIATPSPVPPPLLVPSPAEALPITVSKFADPKFIGKSFTLIDESLYVRREAYMIEFFAYETIGFGGLPIGEEPYQDLVKKIHQGLGVPKELLVGDLPMPVGNPEDQPQKFLDEETVTDFQLFPYASDDAVLEAMRNGRENGDAVSNKFLGVSYVDTPKTEPSLYEKWMAESRGTPHDRQLELEDQLANNFRAVQEVIDFLR